MLSFLSNSKDLIFSSLKLRSNIVDLVSIVES